MNKLVEVMESTWGRGLRGLLGLALVYLGLAIAGGTTRIIIAVIGVVPVIMGLWGPCLVRFATHQSRPV
jgi:hypothetical protein